MKQPCCPKCGSTRVYRFDNFTQISLKHGTLQETFRCRNIKCNPSGSENFQLHYILTPMPKNLIYCNNCERIGPKDMICLCNGNYKKEITP